MLNSVNTRDGRYAFRHISGFGRVGCSYTVHCGGCMLDDDRKIVLLSRDLVEHGVTAGSNV